MRQLGTLPNRSAAERLAAYSEWAEVDLVAAGTEWDADRIRDTSVAQPLIVAASLLSWNALGARSGVAGVAGHSVGIWWTRRYDVRPHSGGRRAPAVPDRHSEPGP